MSNSEINIVGILRPKPGKMQRLTIFADQTPRGKPIELLSAIAARIQVEEKDITRFSVCRDVDRKTGEPSNTLVLIETYQSQATLVRHFAAPEYEEFQATLHAENIIDFNDSIDAEIRAVKQLAGFM